jgi:hypothetical protein
VLNGIIINEVCKALRAFKTSGNRFRSKERNVTDDINLHIQGNYRAGACRHIGWKINAYKVLIWKHDGLFRLRCRCEDNIKIDVTEMRL